MTNLGARVSIKEEQVGLAAIAQSADIVMGLLLNSEKGIEDEPMVVSSPSKLERVFGSKNRLSSGIRLGLDFFKNAGENSGAFAVISRRARPDAVASTVLFNTDQAVFKGIGRGKYYDRLKIVVVGDEDYLDQTTFSYTRFSIIVYEATDFTFSEYVEIDRIDDLSLDDTDDKRFYKDVINDVSFDINIAASTGLINQVPATFKGVEYLAAAVGTGDGIEKSFAATLANFKIQSDSVEILVDGVVVGNDDGFGIIEGAGLTGTINSETGELTLIFDSAPADTLAITCNYFKAPESELSIVLIGGSDGTQDITRTYLTGSSLIASKEGMYAFNKYQGRLIMVIADFETDDGVTKDLLGYTANREINDRFTVCMVPQGYDALKAKRYKRKVLQSNSSFGEVFWPHIRYANELKDGRLDVGSPLGMIIGAYYRKSKAENVNQPMAGTDMYLIGADGLEFAVEQGDVDVAYPASVNPLISRPEGILIWGQKTLAENDDFSQVNTRFLFMKIENELFDPAHAFVFKSIGNRLFAQTKLKVDGYMGNLYDSQYFEADSSSEAFTVTVDETNNTTATIQAKNFNIDVAVLENISGEYVNMRFKKKLR